MRGLEKLKPLALLLLRVALGIIFIYHGYPKLFGHTRETVQSFGRMGFPSYFAYVAGVIELFGGFMMIEGLFARIAGLLIAGEMAVALWRVHNIISDPLAVHNYEFPLMLAVGAFAIAASLGAGAISLDQLLFREGPGSSPRKAEKEGLISLREMRSRSAGCAIPRSPQAQLLALFRTSCQRHLDEGRYSLKTESTGRAGDAITQPKHNRALCGRREESAFSWHF